MSDAETEMSMRRVIVHVDRLVLRGIRQEDHHAIAAGLQQDLGRTFADREAVSLLTASGDVSRLQTSGVYLEYGSTPQRVGQNVARDIGQEMRK